MKPCQQEMTVIQNAWPVVCNFGWLIEADRNARKGKRYRAEVLNFTARLEDNLFTIQQGMMNGSYVLGPYRKLWVYVPKKRLVMALDCPDRIVQWSLYLYLNPIYDRLFIEDSYACRKGKGSHKAAKRLQYWMCQVQRKPGPGWYCLKLDISKYFYRVNHEKAAGDLGAAGERPRHDGVYTGRGEQQSRAVRPAALADTAGHAAGRMAVRSGYADRQPDEPTICEHLLKRA